VTSEEKMLTEARRIVEDLEQRRETVAAVFSDAERKRSAVVYAAQTGDVKAKAESDRLSAELTNLATDAADIETALKTARSNLVEAQAAHDADKRGAREMEAREIVATQIAESKEIDALLLRVSEMLKVRQARCSQLSRLGLLASNRPLHEGRILDAMVAAGLRAFVTGIGIGIGGRGQPLAEADATSLPFGRKVAA
jgi:hypothetical protein